MNVKAAIITAVGIPAALGVYIGAMFAIEASPVAAGVIGAVLVGLFFYFVYGAVDAWMKMNEHEREWRDRRKRDRLTAVDTARPPLLWCGGRTASPGAYG